MNQRMLRRDPARGTPPRSVVDGFAVTAFFIRNGTPSSIREEHVLFCSDTVFLLLSTAVHRATLTAAQPE